jgi:hypothetical protein
MSYKVISFFTDLQDLSYPYKPGDKFPRDGMTVSKERLAELASNSNKQGRPLIQLESEFSQVQSEVTTVYKKSEIKHLTTAELKELAEKEGLQDVGNKTGGELKAELIEHFNL